MAERPELEWREEFTRRGCTFDPKMTVLARNLCDRKNINHRQNVQVFHAPRRSDGLNAVERRAQPYLDDLLSVSQATSRSMTGSLFYVDMNGARSGLPEHSLHWKRENLHSLAVKAQDILEIGFAGGHSALILLLSNAHSKLTIIDPMELPYARPCFEYLNAVFPGRMTLLQGTSQNALPSLTGRTFDLIHVDGGKDKTIESDLSALRSLVSPDGVLVIGDTQNAALEAVVSQWQARGDFETAAFEKMNASATRSRWTHRVGRFSSDAKRDADIIRRMQTIFEGCTHKSIYTQQGPKGEIAGAARATALIGAIRDVEDKALSGAFVEMGVAAGHSSVIAALASSRFHPRDFYLYDTFQGSGSNLPDERDLEGKSIRDYDLTKYNPEECGKPVVEDRMLRAGVLRERLMLIEGPAEETLGRLQPPSIAILRLDARSFRADI